MDLNQAEDTGPLGSSLFQTPQPNNQLGGEKEGRIIWIHCHVSPSLACNPLRDWRSRDVGLGSVGCR